MPAIVISAAASAATIASRAVVCLRTRFIDIQRASAHLLAVQSLNRFFRFATIGHLDKTKTPRTSGIAVRDYRHAFYVSVRLKKLAKIVFRGVEGKVADKEFHFSCFLERWREIFDLTLA
jgi:hypothetical protein